MWVGAPVLHGWCVRARAILQAPPPLASLWEREARSGAAPGGRQPTSGEDWPAGGEREPQMPFPILYWPH